MSQDTPNTTKQKPVKSTFPLSDRSFDGIAELDKKAPNWWLILFYAAIIFYMGWWIVRQNETSTQPLAETTAKLEQLGQLDQLDNETLIAWSENPNIISEGEALYKVNCRVCHGAELNGGIGRSLIDEKWTYGGEPMDLFNLALNGSPKDAPGFKGQKMQAWKETIGAKNIAKIIAFIISKNPNIEK